MVNEVNQMPSTIPNWGLWNLLYIPFLALCIMTPNGCFLGRFTIPFPTWLMSAVLDQRTFRSQLWSAHVLKPWQTQENFFLIFPPNRHVCWDSAFHSPSLVNRWSRSWYSCDMKSRLHRMQMLQISSPTWIYLLHDALKPHYGAQQGPGATIHYLHLSSSRFDLNNP